MRLGAVAVLMAVGILSGCSDSTGAGPGKIDLTVTSVSGPDIVPSGPSLLTITCGVGLSATNTGGASITWLESRVLFYAGPDRSAPVDTLQITAATLEQAWGAATLDAGQNEWSGWSFSANVPFTMTLVLRYRTLAGFPKEARASFDCGPEIPPASAPPVFKALSIQPAAGEIESGDSILVTYTAESAAGLWQTLVILSGACTDTSIIAEQFATTVTRTVTRHVPPGCTLGSPLDVAVQVFDIGLRGVQSGVSLSYVDRTPPTIAAWFAGQATSNILAGFFFAGDTLAGTIGAADNNQLSGALWEIRPAGTRDSVRRAEQSLAQPFAIQIPDAWVGKIQMRLYSRDVAGLVSDTVVVPPDSLRIYPTVGRLIRYTQRFPMIYAVAPDVRHGRAWIMTFDPATGPRVYGVSLATMALSDTIVVRGGWDLDLSAGGDSLIAGAGYGLDVIDLSSSAHRVTHIAVASIDSTRGQYPQLVRTAANGKVFLILLGQTADDNKLVEVDLAAGTDRVRTDAGSGGVVGGAWLEPSLDRSVLFLKGSQQIQKYVSATDAFTAPISHNSSGGSLAVDATGSRVTLGWDLYDGALQYLRTLDTPAPYPTMASALSPDGGTYYESVWPRGILSGDAQTGHLIDRQRAPQTFYMKMAVDGSRLFFIDEPGQRVGVMDLP